ncbi:NfeD family protein [Nocardioides dongxiaopingii]|uniref:NfeD family protein n=1 Tax=Nocardioides sp. S-1144 TaxID=2582905 RepID=UPI001165263F|nr:NfeD family protein [Nocardioides sp. S-1144]QDH10885.1 NfeD family protein [Nocardioides sp. S-1144]
MEWLGDNLWSAWLALAVFLGVAELMSLDLVLIMLAVGAVAGMVTALLGAPVLAQVLVAGGASVAMLALVRPSVVKRLHSGPELSLGHGKLVGRQGVVTAAITANEPGRVRIDGDVWSATPYDPTLTIAAGQTVEVFEIRGATALVHPIPTLEESD